MLNFSSLSFCIVAFFTTTISQAAPDVGRLYGRVEASATWQDFLKVMKAKYYWPVNTDELVTRCKLQIGIEPVEDTERLTENCIRVVLAYLDLNSSYITPEERKASFDAAKWRYFGVGLELTTNEQGFVKIVSTIQGAPSENSGLREGDVIEAIDDRSAKAMTITQVVVALRGDVGTKVTVSVQRAGATEPIRYEITRQELIQNSATGKLVASGTGYVRISSFTSKTRADFLRRVAQLETENRGPLDAIVLDLRRCSGGTLKGVVGAAALFVSRGTKILRVSERNPSDSREYSALPEDYAADGVREPEASIKSDLTAARLVVLIDGKTAAGSEALADFLRASRGASLVGTKTYGFGSVNTFLRIGKDAGVQVATGMMEFVDGRTWHGTGIEPTILIEPRAEASYSLGVLPGDFALAKAISYLRQQ